MARISGKRRQHGYSLIEIAVVTGVAGLLAIGMTSAFDGMQQARRHNAAQAQLETARQALLAFALRNKRLPCPDDVGNGLESSACPASLHGGWLPYAALSLDMPELGQRIRYGVFRQPASADLTQNVFQGIDTPDSNGIGGLTSALEKAAAAAADTSTPYYSTSQAALTSSTCLATDIVNPAFVLVAPLADMDAQGGNNAAFDGPNRNFADNNALCVAPPGHPEDAAYDDIVVAESPLTLLGWLVEATR